MHHSVGRDQSTLAANRAPCPSIGEVWGYDDSRVPDHLTAWTGQYAWQWSHAYSRDRRVAIASSRLPRILDPRGSWLDGLRALVRQLAQVGTSIVTATESAGTDYVRRAAERQQVPVIVIERAEITAPGDLTTRFAETPETNARQHIHLVAIPSKSVAAECDGLVKTTATAAGGETPWHDRAVLAWADDVFVLHVRHNGNLFTLLRRWLAERLGRVFLVDLPGLQSKHVRRTLLELGASLWPASEANRRPFAVPSEGNECLSTRPHVHPPRVPVPSSHEWHFLTHTTRACTGPWPGQSRTDFLDSLLDASRDSFRTPLVTLERIVRERRLRGSSQAIRGGFAVVSFTAVPLARLPQLYRFRAHRSRWDFCPYGVCIRRDWLQRRGARPVTYGDNDVWRRLDLADRPYFQRVRAWPRVVAGEPVASREAESRRRSVDWSIEEEWRVVGDVDLVELGTSDALVFVPTENEARRISEIAPWPIAVLTHSAAVSELFAGVSHPSSIA